MGAGVDGAAGEDVGVDDGEGVLGGEEAGDGGFSGGKGAGEADEEHCFLGGESEGGGRLVVVGEGG